MNDYFLSHGSHQTASEGRCAMEWVAYLAGEPHTDDPVCVSPVLRAFAISLNDQWKDEQRQKLRPYLARCIGTAGDGRDIERSWLAWDWLLREFVPAFMDLTPGLRVHAERLRGLPACLSVEGLDEAMHVLTAAGAAARDAARDAARAAAWDAAGDAARDAAGDAAWDAAGDAAGAAAWDAAWDAARAAAGDAAGDAAGAAARDALAPTVERLQASALDLFDRMLPTEVIQIPVVADADRVCGVIA